MGIDLSTGDLQPKERGAFWRHVMSDTFAPVTIREMAEGDIAGSIRSHPAWPAARRPPCSPPRRSTAVPRG